MSGLVLNRHVPGAWGYRFEEQTVGGPLIAESARLRHWQWEMRCDTEGVGGWTKW
jgi:hypothetical protein